MFAVDDTIVAIATPAGRGGIGVVRLAGPRALEIAAHLIGRSAPLTPRYATFARVELPAPAAEAPAGSPRLADQVVVTAFPAPHSYTGDDVAEISAHGSPLILRSVVAAAMTLGARLAEPGEFTLRAHLNGRLDLVQAEAVADLVEAVTPLQARAAFDQLEGTLTARIREIEGALFDLVARLEASLDFPDEGYHFVARAAAREELAGVRAQMTALLRGAERGRLVREGVQVAIVGTPNVGKSSLFNALVNASRAIVTEIAGTTRDVLRESADLGGMAVSLVDTAGVRAAVDVVEREGVARARQAAAVADLTLLVLDRSRPLNTDDHALIDEGSARRVVVANKSDLRPAWSLADLPVAAVETSVATGAGLEAVVTACVQALGAGEDLRDVPAISNVRHVALLGTAEAAVDRALEAMAVSGDMLSEEFVLADLQAALVALQEVTGARTSDDLLAHIFARFCLGK